jgi:hypothetical protein
MSKRTHADMTACISYQAPALEEKESPPPTDPPPLRWTLADRNAEIERERQEHIERLSKEETEKEREEESVDPQSPPSPSYSPDPAYIGRGQPEGPEESVDPQSPPSPSYSPDRDYIGRGQPLNMPPVPDWRITNNDEDYDQRPRPRYE